MTLPTVRIADLTAQLHAMQDAPAGQVLGTATGHINGAPVEVAITTTALVISFPRAPGRVFAVNLERLAQQAVREVEAYMAQPGGGRS